jgi:hypothetical protein
MIKMWKFLKINYKDNKKIRKVKHPVNKYMANVQTDRLTTCQSEQKSVVSWRPSVLYLSPYFWYFLSQASKYSPQHSVLKCSPSPFFPQRYQVSYTHKITLQFCIFKFVYSGTEHGKIKDS